MNPGMISVVGLGEIGLPMGKLIKMTGDFHKNSEEKMRKCPCSCRKVSRRFYTIF